MVPGRGFFFRVIADGDGWAYRRGRIVLAKFGQLSEALEYAKRDAAANRPSEVILHTDDDEIIVIASYD